MSLSDSILFWTLLILKTSISLSRWCNVTPLFRVVSQRANITDSGNTTWRGGVSASHIAKITAVLYRNDFLCIVMILQYCIIHVAFASISVAKSVIRWSYCHVAIDTKTLLFGLSFIILSLAVLRSRKIIRCVDHMLN